MKSVGIATITAARNLSFNYGNILQNYALSAFIRKKGFRVSTIYYLSTIPEFTLQKFVQEREKRGVLQFADDALRIVRRNVQRKLLIEKKEHRDKGFLNFIDNNLVYTSETYTNKSSFTALNKEFDFFVAGSDQVWNPYYEGSNEFFYLPFADRAKRITYAPSIGVNHIPDEIKSKIGNWFQNFDSISIREEEGQRIIKENYGIDSKVVCDPVFLLSTQDWLDVSSKRSLEQSYFAVYILGKKCVETKIQLRHLEKRYGVRAIDIYTRDNPDALFCSPEEFLTVLNESEFIVTDSFHATAFSILFEKPVVIIDRNASNKHSNYKMNGRIDNLLDLVGLTNRGVLDILTGKSDLHKVADISQSKLLEFIEYSKQYLLDSLGIIDT